VYTILQHVYQHKYAGQHNCLCSLMDSGGLELYNWEGGVRYSFNCAFGHISSILKSCMIADTIQQASYSSNSSVK